MELITVVADTCPSWVCWALGAIVLLYAIGIVFIAVVWYQTRGGRR